MKLHEYGWAVCHVSYRQKIITARLTQDNLNKVIRSLKGAWPIATVLYHGRHKASIQDCGKIEVEIKCRGKYKRFRLHKKKETPTEIKRIISENN